MYVIRSRTYTHVKESPLPTHLVGGWVDLRAKLGISEERKIPDHAT